MVIIIVYLTVFISSLILNNLFFTELWGLVWGGGTGFKSLPVIWLA